jgi:hypothetical protein
MGKHEGSAVDYKALYEARVEGERMRAVASIVAGLVSIAAGVLVIRGLRKA